MGVSIYYSATRKRPLSPEEYQAVIQVEAGFPVETLIAECRMSEAEFDGEAFCVYPSDAMSESRVIFEGATKLPLCSEDAFGAAIQFWCRLLSEIRRVLINADWHVHIDDHDIAWNEESGMFDPSF